MEAAFTAGFSLRQDLLLPVAAAACGKAARALAERLLQCSDDQLSSLRAAAGKDVLIIAGETEALPWVDGTVYLGRDPLAPRLLIPAMMQPDVAADVFERAIARQAVLLPPPWAVLIAPPRVFSAAYVTAIDRAHILRWLEPAA
jgi:hypothetical protein